METLAVIIPAFNEAGTLPIVVERVRRSGCVSEIILVDDGSTDGTRVVAESLSTEQRVPLRPVFHPVNKGKGAAIRTALAEVRSDLVLIQDADLEYSPEDYPVLLAPFSNAAIEVVYGSRNLKKNPRSTFWFYWGGCMLSWITNLLYGSCLTDEATGYKVVRTALLRSLDIRSDGFDFCPEITGKLLRRGVRIHEVPIRYHPRSRAEGKKIRMRDGWRAIWVLLRERFSA